MNKKAFTLAEVLITLGIIGVVAALTLPSLIQKRTNLEVESKLKKIYSVMNQAILMSELDNGAKEYWPKSCSGSNGCHDYYSKYIIPYIKETSVNEFNSFGGTNIAIYFTDGSALVGKQGFDYFFFPSAKNLDRDDFAQLSDSGNLSSRKDCGITYFAFQFAPSFDDENHKFHYQKGFEPYKGSLLEFTEDNLRNGSSFSCNKNSSVKVWCTALIQLNGWKIPNDYPFKVK